jgi:phytoene/squalene synthetase
MALRKLQLVALNVLANRRQPPLAQLAALRDPERFVWHILPHAARSFSFCIIALPERMARALAVAYLYCRMLDSYEDLPPTLELKVQKLRAFVDRFSDAAVLQPAPTLEESWAPDPQEASHVLLVQRAALVDEVYGRLSSSHQRTIRRLVTRMGEGMIWSAETFAAQQGRLLNEAQLSDYCDHVLGNPMVFAEEMQRLDCGMDDRVEGPRRQLCRATGEAIQLANVTRDLEKDVVRGVYYHPALAGVEPNSETLAQVRRLLLRRGMLRAAAFRPFAMGVPTPKWSLSRGACLLLLLFTYRYYQKATARAGMSLFDAKQQLHKRRAFGWWLKAVLSRRSCDRVLEQMECGFAQALKRCPEVSPPLPVQTGSTP